MRIPPSVFVMSLLCAVPFGLGIRDTLASKDASADGDDDESADDGFDLGGSKRSARERRRELEQYEAEMRREQIEREERSAARIAKLGQLYGTTPASLGTLLEGISIGASAGSFQPEHVRQRIERESRDGFITVAFDADATSLNAIAVTVDSDYETVSACDKLEDNLLAAWGPSSKRIWLDPTTHQRATLTTDDGCVLRFDRYLEANDWVAALPTHLIGASVDKLTTTLGGAVDESGDDFVTWHMPGLRFGKTATKLEAYILHNKVAGFKVIADSDFDTTLAVRDALSAKLKAQPKKDPEADGTWTWKSRTAPATLEDIDTDRFALVFGTF